ncbi:hypothetical protein [Micromonospora sp. RTP1Z1]|uniref:hypothetical protein n=1 Tax=Micromonospora sp. RTP1Z1 TaxID=2994043 RepID=UPI0029C92900|nr:hypothetical protein [Micromonospora sp. RTP1Z1]
MNSSDVRRVRINGCQAIEVQWTHAQDLTASVRDGLKPRLRLLKDRMAGDPLGGGGVRCQANPSIRPLPRVEAIEANEVDETEPIELPSVRQPR